MKEDNYKKFYGCKYDLAFKGVFKNNIDLLEYLISGIIGKKIKITKFLSNEVDKQNINEKGRILDILAEADGKKISIEVNTETDIKNIDRRNYSYSCDVYEKDLKKGESYDKMNDIYQVSFFFNYEKNVRDINKFRVHSVYDSEEYVDNVTFYKVRVENLRRKGYNNLSKFEKFIAAIGENDPKVLEDLSKSDRRIDKMTKKLEDMNSDKEFIEFMDSETENRLYENTLKSESYTAGKNAGVEEGKAEGIIENKKEIAKKMLEDKIPINTIIKYTGLSKEEIENIKTRNN